MRYYTCCICGQTFVGYGNNPWPVNDDENAECCNRCNIDIVVSSRLKQIMENSSGTEQSK